MRINQQIILSPNPVALNALMTIRPSNDHFQEQQYIISDTTGRLIRKGTIYPGTQEIILCLVGLQAGEYQLSMGQGNCKFIVI